MRVLTSQGFTRAELRLYPFFVCDHSEIFNTAFTALDAAGNSVEGAVCCTLGGGCTVRQQ